MAILWARKIINREKTFQDVPRLLKNQVQQVLIDWGYEYLVK